MHVFHLQKTDEPCEAQAACFDASWSTAFRSSGAYPVSWDISKSSSSARNRASYSMLGSATPMTSSVTGQNRLMFWPV